MGLNLLQELNDKQKHPLLLEAESTPFQVINCLNLFVARPTVSGRSFKEFVVQVINKYFLLQCYLRIGIPSFLDNFDSDRSNTLTAAELSRCRKR